MPPKLKMPIRRSNSGPRQADVIKPHGPPKRGRKTIKLTAKQVYDTCWASRKKGVARLAVRNVKQGVMKKSDVLPPDTPYYRVAIYSKDQKHDHKVTIFLPEGKPLTTKSHIIHDCNCADSMFTFEYAMAKRNGTMFLWRCNGEPPMQRNPGNVSGICKHTRLALFYLLTRAKAKTLNRIDRRTDNTTRVSFKNG